LGRNVLGSFWQHEADDDALSRKDQTGQMVGIFGSVLVLLYFVSLWMGDAGFYTSQFSDVDAVVLFIPILLGIFPAFIRMVFMRQNPSRPFDVLNAALFVLSAIYFLNDFHFDMSHFSYPFPESLRFLVDWIDEGWARIVLVVGIFGGTIGSIWIAITYVKVRQILKNGRSP
jgi:hypothetical protein